MAGEVYIDKGKIRVDAPKQKGEKTMKKRILAMVLAGMAAISLVGCSGGSETAATTAAQAAGGSSNSSTGGVEAGGSGVQSQPQT